MSPQASRVKTGANTMAFRPDLFGEIDEVTGCLLS